MFDHRVSPSPCTVLVVAAGAFLVPAPTAAVEIGTVVAVPAREIAAAPSTTVPPSGPANADGDSSISAAIAVMVTNAPEQCEACKKRFCEPFGKYDAVRILIADR